VYLLCNIDVSARLDDDNMTLGHFRSIIDCLDPHPKKETMLIAQFDH
jgi:hypothetical protein